jgi:hypothetical protein
MAIGVLSAAPAVDPDLAKAGALCEEAVAELNRFREEGGRAGDPADPALKWAPVLWQFYLDHAGSPAGSQAASTCLSLWWLSNQDETALEKGEQLDPNDPAWLRGLSRFRWSAEKTGQQARFFRQTGKMLAAVKDPALRATVLFQRGQAQANLKRAGEAVADYRAAIREAPGSAVAAGAEAAIGRLTSTVPGVLAPSFEAVTLDGRKVSLDDYRGKVVLLNFWASW